MSSQVVTFYEDKEMTKAILPRTKVSAISDDSGTALSEMVLYHGDGIDSYRVLIDADLLQGHNASYFTSKSDFNTKIEELNTAIANSGLKMDLLWTNASPTSVFEPQTISLDLSQYRAVFIFIFCSNSFTTEGSWSFIIKSPTKIRIGFAPSEFRALYYDNDNEIRFERGFSTTINDYNNAFAIPYQIYGVK